MKNRKKIIVAFILVACMLVGVGYAVVTDTFKVTGNIKVSQEGAEDVFNQNIRFVGIVKESGQPPVSDVLASENLGYTASCNVPTDEASFHVTGIKAPGETKSVTFRIQNFGDVDATLNFTVDPQFDNSAFSVTHDLTNGFKLEKNKYVDITFTVEILNSVTEATEGQFVFSFTASSDVSSETN